jgi:hypothetical protein
MAFIVYHFLGNKEEDDDDALNDEEDPVKLLNFDPKCATEDFDSDNATVISTDNASGWPRSGH